MGGQYWSQLELDGYFSIISFSSIYFINSIILSIFSFKAFGETSMDSFIPLSRNRILALSTFFPYDFFPMHRHIIEVVVYSILLIVLYSKVYWF